jgi:hypothetical protein
MVIAIWLIALFVLLLWSAFAWMCHALLGMIVGLPWEQVLAQLKVVNLPEPFGAWWTMMVDLFAPVLQASLPALQGLLSFAGGTLPVMLGVVWFIGAALVLLAAIVATVGAALWRKNRTAIKSKLSRL